MKIFIILLTYACYFLSIVLCEVSQVDSKSVETFIGDENYTRILRQEFKKQHRYLVAIMFTNKNCQTCESFEPELRNIQKEFLKNQIPIFRCQISQSLKLNERFKIKRFPMIHFVIKKFDNHKGDFTIKIYKTNQIVTISILQTAKYIKKVLDFQIQLFNRIKGDKGSKKDTNLIKTLQQIPEMNRIIINVDYLLKNYNTSLQEVMDEIILNQSFNNLAIVPLSNELFSYYKVINDIEDHQQNNNKNPWIIVSIKTGIQNQFRNVFITNQHIDKFSNQNFDLLSIFKSFLLYSVQQFTQDIFDIKTKVQSVSNIKKPTYLAVLDSIWQRNKSMQHIDMLNKIMHQFEYQINIFWTQAQINTQKKVLLGFDKQQQPPLFGRLILTGDQLKQPLKNPSTGQAIFTEHEIRKRIRQDLGYQVKLVDKINQSLEQAHLSQQISIKDHINFQATSFMTKFILCTYHKISQRQIESLYFIYSRFKRFNPNSKLIILTPPCLFNNEPIKQGLYMVFKKTINFISFKIKQCIDVQDKIINVSDKFAYQMNRVHLLPEHFCVPEQQMRDYLMTIL